MSKINLVHICCPFCQEVGCECSSQGKDLIIEALEMIESSVHHTHNTFHDECDLCILIKNLRTTKENQANDAY